MSKRHVASINRRRAQWRERFQAAQQTPPVGRRGFPTITAMRRGWHSGKRPA